jgi:MFS family permease
MAAGPDPNPDGAAPGAVAGEGPAAPFQSVEPPRVAVPGEGPGSVTPTTQVGLHAALLRALPALRSRPYRRFFVGALVGNLGLWMQSTAQGWLVLQLTNSPALLGLTSAAASAPTLFLTLVAGVLADRVDRPRLIVACQLVAAASAAVLAVLVTVDQVRYWHVLVLATVAGAAQAFATPALQAIVPSLVERAALGNAVALNSAQFNLSRVVGPAIAGLAIAAGGLALAFWANALALVAVAVAVWSVGRLSPAAIIRAESSLWRNLVDGLRFVAQQRLVAAILGLAVVPSLLVLNYLALLPLYARDILRIGAGGLGLLTAAVGIGALVGALGVALLRPGGGGGRLMLAALGLGSMAVAVFGLVTELSVALVALAVVGAALTAYYSTANTLIQLLSPPRLRGRILSLWTLAALGAVPIGNLVAGAVADRFGGPVALGGGGLLSTLVVAVVAVLVPELRTVGPRAGIGAGRSVPGGDAAAGPSA